MADANGRAGSADAIAKRVREAAERALAEAHDRRAAWQEQRAATGAGQPGEIAGRDGPEPVRYGDWEVKGLASDF